MKNRARGTEEGTSTEDRLVTKTKRGHRVMRDPRLGKLDPGLLPGCVVHLCAHAQNNIQTEENIKITTNYRRKKILCFGLNN